MGLRIHETDSAAEVGLCDRGVEEGELRLAPRPARPADDDELGVREDGARRA